MNHRAFFKMATTLATPIMVQNLISTLVSSADTIMLGYVSQNAMAASSLANQLQSVLFCTFYGFTAGTSVLASQYWGKGDHETIERVLGLATRIALLISFIFFVAGFCFPTQVMRLFTDDLAIIQEGVRYLRIIAFSYVFMGFAQIYVCVLRSIGKVVLPTVTYVVSLVLNIAINATFIFGLFGLPKLGLVGVALGTVIARFAECAICLVYSQAYSEVKVRLKWMVRRAGILAKDFAHISVPSMANDIAWSLAVSVYSSVIGHMGSDVVAANAVALMALNIGAVVSRGFANATTIVVSRELGANRMDTAKEYARRMLRLSMLFGACGALVMVAIRPLMIAIYAGKLTDAAIALLRSVLVMRAVQLIGEATNTCLICGCFRGGGDARYGMVVDILSMWLVAVPLTLMAAYVFKLPPVWVYFVMCLDEFEKMLPVFLHYRKFEWLHNITRDQLT